MSEEFNFMTEPVATPLPPIEMKRKGRPWRTMAIIVGTFLAILLIISAIGLGIFLSGVSQGQKSITAATDAAIQLDFDSAQTNLSDAEAGFTRAKTGLILLRWTYILPWVGSQTRAVSAVTDAGVESIAALKQAVGIAADVYTVVIEAQEIIEATGLPEGTYTFEDFPKEKKKELLQTLNQSHSKLLEMQVSLRLAQDDINELKGLKNVTPQILSAIEPFEKLLPQIIAGIDILVPLSATVGELAGVGEDRQWLVLFLNNTEMRPAGGFIGVYGLMLMRDGEIKNMSIDDSYDVDRSVQDNPGYYVAPPAPLKEYMGVNTWYFRDANWSPDFPTSAKDATQLLRQEVAFSGQPAPQVHGVIGFTPTLAESLLEITGPITIEGLTFTSANVTRLLEFEVEYGFENRGEQYEQRKAIVGRLTDEVMKKLFALPVTRWGEVFEAVQNSLINKQLAFFSFDGQTQSAFNDANWSSALDPSGVDDVLMVVDANLAALKTDPSVERQITYHIEKQGEDYVATTSIKYKHFGKFDLFTTRYRTYTRVYAPLGSELIGSSGTLKNDKLSNPGLEPGIVNVVDDMGMTSFGAFTSIEPGQEGTLTFTYRLPETIKEAIDKNLYELKVFKQMGSANHALTIDLDFDKKVRAASPSEEKQNFSDQSYNLNTILDQNSLVRVQF